jgi:molybdopterin synthase sulfur carrier subunit
VIALRLFAQAREAAGEKVVHFEAETVGEVLDLASARFGNVFDAVLEGSKVWLNGSPCERIDSVTPGDEVAVLPPVSGG